MMRKWNSFSVLHWRGPLKTWRNIHAELIPSWLIWVQTKALHSPDSQWTGVSAAGESSLRPGRKVSWDEVTDPVSAGTPQWAGLFLSCCGDGWRGGLDLPWSPPGETCPPEDERPVDTTTSNDAGKGHPVSILQGFTLDEPVKTRAAETDWVFVSGAAFTSYNLYLAATLEPLWTLNSVGSCNTLVQTEMSQKLLEGSNTWMNCNNFSATNKLSHLHKSIFAGFLHF